MVWKEWYTYKYSEKELREIAEIVLEKIPRKNIRRNNKLSNVELILNVITYSYCPSN